MPSVQISGSLRPKNVNTPVEDGSVIATLADMENIVLPYVGKLVYCLATGKYYRVTTLNQDEDAVAEYEEAVPSPVYYDEQSHIIYINGQAYSGLVLQPLQCDVPYFEHPFNEVEIFCFDSEAVIYYTIAQWDSSTSSYAPVVVPTAQNGTLYTGPITVTSGQKFKITAVATKSGYADSTPISENVEYRNITPPESGSLGATEPIHNGPNIDF